MRILFVEDRKNLDESYTTVFRVFEKDFVPSVENGLKYIHDVPYGFVKEESVKTKNRFTQKAMNRALFYKEVHRIDKIVFEFVPN